MGELRRMVGDLFAPRGEVPEDRRDQEDENEQDGGGVEGQERRPARQFQVLDHGAVRDLMAARAARVPRSLNARLKRSLRSFASGVIADVRVAPVNSGDWSM